MHSSSYAHPRRARKPLPFPLIQSADVPRDSARRLDLRQRALRFRWPGRMHPAREGTARRVDGDALRHRRERDHGRGGAARVRAGGRNAPGAERRRKRCARPRGHPAGAGQLDVRGAGPPRRSPQRVRAALPAHAGAGTRPPAAAPPLHRLRGGVSRPRDAAAPPDRAHGVQRCHSARRLRGRHARHRSAPRVHRSGRLRKPDRALRTRRRQDCPCDCTHPDREPLPCGVSGRKPEQRDSQRARTWSQSEI
jgi:hypothetical protein